MNPDDLERWTPIITSIIAVLGGSAVVGGFAVFNRKRGNAEGKTPTVAQLWEQQAKDAAERDAERTLRRWYETAFWRITEAFRGYVSRVASGGPVELRDHERAALDATPPTIDKE